MHKDKKIKLTCHSISSVFRSFFFTPTCLSCIFAVEIQIQHVTCLSVVSSRKYSNMITSISRKRPVLTALLFPGSQSFLFPGCQSFLVHGCQSFLVHGCQSFLVHGSHSFLVHGGQSFLVHGSQFPRSW